jgi:type VI secretion system protein ImpH
MKILKPLFDMKAETFIAAMLEENPRLELEQMIVSLQGLARRRSSYEVSQVKSKQYEDRETVCRISVQRKGLYDNLPQGLFLALETPPDSDPIAVARATEAQIAATRQFLLPFEQAMYLPRIETEILEKDLTIDFPDFLETFWGLEEHSAYLTREQRHSLYYFLPEAHRIVGDWATTALFFEQIMGHTVRICPIAPLIQKIPKSEKAMDSMCLGENSFFSGSFKDDIPALEISILGVTTAELPDFLPEGRQRKVLENILYAHFLPLESETVTKIGMVETHQKGFKLETAVLGYNVQL